MISDAIAMYELLDKKWINYKVISALFRWDGSKLYGDDKINITKHDVEDSTWFYSINDFDDYIFIRIPTNASAVIEKPGVIVGEKNADTKYFRYVSIPDGRIYGGTLPNVKVDFMVIGYQPKYLLRIKE